MLVGSLRVQFSSPHASPVNGLQEFRALAPVFLNLDEQLQEDFAAENLLHLLARECANLLQCCSLSAYDNGFLTGPLDVYRSADSGDVRRFRPLVHNHCHGVRHFLPRLPQHFFRINSLAI